MNGTLALMAALLLSACAAGEDYRLPELPLPAWWSAAPEAEEAPQPIFTADYALGDETLRALLARAGKGNPSLSIANARIAEARGEERSATAALFPGFSAGANASRAKQGFESLGLPAGVAGFPAFSKPINLYDARFDARWELDVFGRNRRGAEAAAAQIQAREAEAENARLLLYAEIARQYISLRQLQAQLALTRKAAEAQTRLSGIAQERFRIGTGSRFEASQAESASHATGARLPKLEQAVAATANRLCLLLGEAPGALAKLTGSEAPLPAASLTLALDAPASVIARRPDVRAAERQLAAAAALNRQAIAATYPDISLSALLGLQDSSIGERTRIWSLGGGIVAPLFHFGRLEGQIDASGARQEQAFQRYRQAVLEALAEIDGIVTDAAAADVRIARLAQAAESAERTYTLAKERYDHGISALTEVLDAERFLYGTQNEWIEARAERAVAQARLYKALAYAPENPGNPTLEE